MDWIVTLTVEAEAPVSDDQVDAIVDELAVPVSTHDRFLTLTMAAAGAHFRDAEDHVLEVVEPALWGAGVAFTVQAVEAITEAEQDRRLAEPAFPELVGVTEIAQLLEVSRQRASALQKLAGFPAPVAVLASGPVWRRGDLDRFSGVWRRAPGRPPRDTARSAG